ncbi:hypothetical protein GCM10012275_23080 [Longimycelium tulufanense]|uniref:DUF1697 domain-containing protein n=1 Tax=Longimycelium tulufanense TaxID=907463 RepID=A0A8J3FW96_9PSEU|nr:DUF1697 domain-containing protein [Longimycelium tulufanense]GGM51596.1 hypothetical protein GCM10012275_23080 [Longimycelium tulufanense]
MTRYALLLRGINVGGRTKVPMAELRQLLSGLGYAGVATLLQSGNAVVECDHGPGELVAEVERAIGDRFGMAVPCLVRTEEQLRGVIEGNPLATVHDDGAKLLALFLSEAPDPELLRHNDPTRLDANHIRVGERVIYQWCPDGARNAPDVRRFVEQNLKVSVTARNWNTVCRLREMLAG